MKGSNSITHDERRLNAMEHKNLQLEMLIEIDQFCLENNIRYSLAFGTLLGAIRHKGFIPWDDDVDIMMPLPDMLRFKSLFKSKHLKYCDVDTEKHYEYAFSRIASLKTYKRRGKVEKSYGVCIDLYPVISLFNTEKENERYFKDAKWIQKRRLFLFSLRTRLMKLLPITTIPGFDRAVRRHRDYMLNTKEYGTTNYYYAIAGSLHLRNKMIYNFDLFEKLIDVEFEGMTFKGTAYYDKYLSQRYGDYMKLPPENERVPYHGGDYFWR